MKVRSREINIFSMSALDLFASALGAFILLSVMSLPFFPNTSMSPPIVIETPPDPEPIPDPPEDPVLISDLDLVIALDITASMGDQLDQLKNQVVDVVRVLDRLAPSVGIGMVAYGDVEYDQPLTVLEITSTTDLATIRSFVDSLVLEEGRGNGDNPSPPEALGMALDRAVNMNWRAVSLRHHIVIVTDAPPYTDEIRSSLVTAEQFAAVSDPQQFVATVLADPDDSNNAAPFLRDLAEAGNGEFIGGDDGQSMLASIILAIANL